MDTDFHDVTFEESTETDDDTRTPPDDDIESAIAAVRKTQQYSDLVARNFLTNLSEHKEDLMAKNSNEGSSRSRPGSTSSEPEFEMQCVTNTAEQYKSTSALKSSSHGNNYLRRLSNVLSEGSTGLFFNARKNKDTAQGLRELVEREAVLHKNLTPDLVLTCLKDGKFMAKIRLPQLTKKSMAVQICDTQLVIGQSNLTQDANLPKDTSKKQWNILGHIDLPMFLNMDTFEFKFEDFSNILFLEAQVKGCSGSAF